MTNLKARILSSDFINRGLIGKCKDFVYTKFISDRLEAKTDAYRNQILTDFYEIYYEEPWILGFGSFLRFYRDQTMDGQDIDIMIEKRHFDLHKQELQKKGYKLMGVFYDANQRISEYKLMYEDAEIDIFFVFQDNEGYYYQSTYTDPEHKDAIKREVVQGDRIVSGAGYCSYQKRLYDFACAEYELQGCKFKGYRYPEVHLESEYGDWQTPCKEFRWFTYPEHNQPKKFSGAKAIYYEQPKTEY